MTKIILIVGASGVGKDTLLRSIKNKIDATFASRYITRKPDNNESNFYVDHYAFEILRQKDFFVSTWVAHNNRYGIPKCKVEYDLCIISISRGAIKDFEAYYDDVTTIEITLPRDILYKRLKNRGREDEDAIQKRLDRNYEKIDAKNLIQFINDKPLEESTKEFLKILESIK